MSNGIPQAAVVRLSKGSFDPANFDAVNRMVVETGSYLVPLIERLEGLIAYFAASAPDGSMIHVSIWDSDDHASQMGKLKEMIVDARQAAEAVGVEFIPIVNYPIAWNIEAGNR